MTREEAIKILADLTDNFFLHTWEEQYKALHMAIEALKAEPTGDLISRANAIGAWDKLSKRGRTEFDQVLMTLPSADVEWIPITTSEPTTSNHVLVTYNWGDDDYDDYETSELDYWVTKCAAEEGNKQCQMFIDHVIAWSFLPQPYKER